MHRKIAGSLTGRYTKWAVLVFWIIAAAGMGTLFGKLVDVQNNEASSWLPESAESTRVLEELTGVTDPNDIPTLVVYEREGGLTEADLAAIEEQGLEIGAIDGVTDEGVLTPAVAEQAGIATLSEDGEAAYSAFTLNFGSDGWMSIPEAADEIRDLTAIDGVTVHLAGFGGQASDQFEVFEGIDSNLILITLSVVIVILLFTYRSPILWILPIISSVVAVAVAGGVVYLLARYADLTVNGQSQAILNILVIGAGTDYALLLVARYREELHRHEDRHAAMGVALHRATPAILASAATVIAGMLCLVFAGLNSTAGLGPVSAVGIGVTFLVMVTLLPALLVIFGRWIFWPKRPLLDDEPHGESGLWTRVGNAISKSPRKVWVVTTAALLAACFGLVTLDTNGLSTEDSYTTEFDSVKGQKILVEHGLQDSSNTVQVVTNAGSLDAVTGALGDIDGLGAVSQPVPIGDRAFVEAVLEEDVSSQAAFAIVEETRDVVGGIEGADALVGGNSAFFLDTRDTATADSLLIMPLVLLVVLIILVVLLRALLAPLILIATVVLSFGAALGISSLLFEYVFGFAGSDAQFPLFAFIFLVALGIDYNIFLMTRVREETAVHGTRRGSLIALASTGGVITSAGLVLAATFLVLGSIPLVFLAQLGITVALGILLDTMLVRSVLVTAINLDLGGKVWWPSSLDRHNQPSTGEQTQEPETVTV